MKLFHCCNRFSRFIDHVSDLYHDCAAWDSRIVFVFGFLLLEDRVQQVSTSIRRHRVTCTPLSRNYAQWRVKIFAFFSNFLLLLRLCFILLFSLGNGVFRRSLEFFFRYWVSTDISCISILFVSSIFNLLRISVTRNFYSHFIVHFSFYRIMYDVAQRLWIKNAANR